MCSGRNKQGATRRLISSCYTLTLSPGSTREARRFLDTERQFHCINRQKPTARVEKKPFTFLAQVVPSRSLIGGQGWCEVF